MPGRGLHVINQTVISRCIERSSEWASLTTHNLSRSRYRYLGVAHSRISWTTTRFAERLKGTPRRVLWVTDETSWQLNLDFLRGATRRHQPTSNTRSVVEEKFRLNCPLVSSVTH